MPHIHANTGRSQRTLEQEGEQGVAYANASRASDKEAILFRILDPAWSNIIRTFAFFKQVEKAGRINKNWFREFDAHVCSLLGTPMLRAGLQAKSAAVCMRAIGMGAEATAAIVGQCSTACWWASATAQL